MARNESSDFITHADSRAVFSAALTRGRFTAARLSANAPAERVTERHVIEDAFMIAVQLRDYTGDLWLEGKPVDVGTMREGTFSFYDYRRNWQANLRSEFDCVNFHLPRLLINSIAEEDGGRLIDTLTVAPGVSVDDPAIHALSRVMLTALAAPQGANPLFIDQVTLAFCAHLITTYGDSTPLARPAGSLAPWQCRAAIEMMSSATDQELSIQALADRCRLSRSYFLLAFKRTFNITPHQWVARRRLENAQKLMRETNWTLGRIAEASGYSDQAHMTRHFQSRLGLTPTAWRKFLL